jgi:hypothetical protein
MPSSFSKRAGLEFDHGAWSNDDSMCVSATSAEVRATNCEKNRFFFTLDSKRRAICMSLKRPLPKGVPSAPVDIAGTRLGGTLPAAGRWATNRPKPRRKSENRFAVVLVGLAIGFTAPTFAQQKETVDPKIAQQIRALASNYDSAFNRQEAPAVVALYTEDAVLNMPNGAFNGRQASDRNVE